ncbi:hypothetical protein [Neptunomonas phycophila]|uniref:hypothetical protein n=1 Tax=Neptunomonas phycophila TaxID=1572645 RepID=UPI003515EEE4
MNMMTQTMLPDGTNPEGVDPFPPLNLQTREELTDIVVHGPAFSHATTKLRAFLVYADLPFTHMQHLKAKPQGIRPGTDYRKVPNIDVAGRQVNDSGIILKHLLPAIGLEFNHEWEERIVNELDTTFKLHCTSEDWARLAVATMGAPRFMKWLIGPMLKRLECKQARYNIKMTGLGHREGDEVKFAIDFKHSMSGKFHNGDTPGHVDISFYGFLAGYLHGECAIAETMINKAGLHSWAAKMKRIIPLKKLFEHGW